MDMAFPWRKRLRRASAWRVCASGWRRSAARLPSAAGTLEPVWRRERRWLEPSRRRNWRRRMTEPTEPITVMIVDDHAVVRQGIRALLEAEGGFQVVGEAGSGGEAALFAADLAPDVVLMDLVMPEMDGVTAT